MLRLSEDEAEWRRLVEGSRGLRHLADTERFADGVEALIRRSQHQETAAELAESKSQGAKPPGTVA